MAKAIASGALTAVMVGALVVTLPEFPFQEGSSLNAANITYTSLKGAAALKRLRELESLSPPGN